MKVVSVVAVSLFILTSACSKSPGDANHAIAVKAEIPTVPKASTITEDPNLPPEVLWNQIDYINDNFMILADRDGDGAPDPRIPGCPSEIRFSISKEGNFVIQDNCIAFSQSGTLTSSQLKRINRKVSNIDVNEASSNLICDLYNAPVGYPGKSAHIELQTPEGQNFTLWKGFGAQICFPKDKAEIADLHATLWDILKDYVTMDYATN